MSPLTTSLPDLLISCNMYTYESDTFRKRNRQLVVWREGVAYQDLDQISVRYLQGLYLSGGEGDWGAAPGKETLMGSCSAGGGSHLL